MNAGTTAKTLRITARICLWRSRFPGLCLCAVAFTAGCRDRESDGFARFVPAPETARRALATGLEAWREGRASGVNDGATPKVLLIDSRRQAGRRLNGFELLGEFPADNARGFAARLTLQGDDAEAPAVARFLILGIDPIWVYRQEDFEMFCHWMHAMEEPKADVASQSEATKSGAR